MRPAVALVEGLPAMSYYLFARLPHMPPAWTLAVLAVSAADARRHVRATWRGGVLVAIMLMNPVSST